jgi:hypothetical protein
MTLSPSLQTVLPATLARPGVLVDTYEEVHDMAKSNPNRAPKDPARIAYFRALCMPCFAGIPGHECRKPESCPCDRKHPNDPPVHNGPPPEERRSEVGSVTGGDPDHPQTVYVTRYDSRGASEPDGSPAPRGYVGLGIQHEGEHVYIHMLEDEAVRVIDLLTESLEDLRSLVPAEDLSPEQMRELPPA